jgi:hypothetical protein
MDKQDFFKKIKNNIDNYSFHITVVKAKEYPRFGYTIGNYEKYNCEFIIAGNINFQYEEVLTIFGEVILKFSEIHENSNIRITTSKFGSFSLSKIHSSWSKKMMLGVYDYYNIADFTAYQILADNEHFTLDIPNISIEWNPKDLAIWKWLDEDIKWNLDVPRDSIVITNLSSLFGEKITEVMRWEENEWEAFTQNGEEINSEDIRIVPIGVLLGIDDTLKSILKLDIEKGLRRDEKNIEWIDWG